MQTHEYCKSIRNFTFFQRFLTFFNVQEKSKLTFLLHSSNICSFHMQKRIESVDGLRRYTPYKPMLESFDTWTDRRADRTEYYSSPLRAKAAAGD